jgi:hypothetical protein
MRWKAMLKEKSLQGEPVRGGNNSTVSQNTYKGYIPPVAFNALRQEAAGIIHGTATLILHVRDGKLTRYTISKERSFMGDNDE